MRKKSVPNFKTKQERIAFWYPICQARHASNLTGVAFCAKYKVSRSPLQKWMKYFAKHQYISQPPSKVKSTTVSHPKTMVKNQKKANSTFIPVAITETQPNILTKQPNNHMAIKEDATAIELLFPNGVKLIFNQGIDVNFLTHLITAVGA